MTRVKFQELCNQISASVAFHHSSLNSVTPTLLPPFNQDHLPICVIEIETKQSVSVKSVRHALSCTIGTHILKNETTFKC